MVRLVETCTGTPRVVGPIPGVAALPIICDRQLWLAGHLRQVRSIFNYLDKWYDVSWYSIPVVDTCDRVHNSMENTYRNNLLTTRCHGDFSGHTYDCLFAEEQRVWSGTLHLPDLFVALGYFVQCMSTDCTLLWHRGWMARVWMKEYGDSSDVHTLLCLGSPLQ